MTDLTISGGKLWDAGVRYGFRDDAGWGVYIPLVSAATANALSADDRRAIFDGWNDVRDWAREFTEKELVTGIEANAKNGVTVFTPSDDDREAMRAKLVNEQGALVRAGRMDAAFVARVGAYLDELRAGGPP
jgi:TRAP-type C4-dicarboxylate transport system substrate-binding protein